MDIYSVALPRDEALTTKFRRNGKLQSCEPCRKSKLRCDHKLPTCGRCIRRRCLEKCVYHPAPLSQTPKKENKTPPQTKLFKRLHGLNGNSSAIVSSIEQHDEADISSPAEPSGLQHCQSPRGIDAGPEIPRAMSAPPGQSWREPLRRDRPGFLGETSYQSLLAENMDTIGVHPADFDGHDAQDLVITPEKIARGCRILSFLKDRHKINLIVSRWFDLDKCTGRTCPEFVMKNWLLQFWPHHAPATDSQNPEKIRKLCILLWRNTQSPLVINEKTTPMEWVKSASGPNIRWEVIGLIATTIGLCTNILTPSEQELKSLMIDRVALVKQMQEISETCLSFCRDCDSVDYLFAWLTIDKLELNYQGDNKFSTYQTCGEMVSAVFAMGLHQSAKKREPLPFFMTELRKRLLVSTYCGEIALATALGRPPRFPYRYSVFELPLDVKDNDIFVEPNEISNLLKSLTKDGWNKQSKVSANTHRRVMFLSAMYREDILDLAMANHTRDEILRRAAEIKQSMSESRSRFPLHIQSICEGAAVTDGAANSRTPVEKLLCHVMYLGVLANDLQLERVLVSKTGASPEERLTATAWTTFKYICSIGRQRDLEVAFHLEIWLLLLVHGLRSATIVAVALLKQEIARNYHNHYYHHHRGCGSSDHKSSSGTRLVNQPFTLPRSETIQELSVFAAKLGSVDPQVPVFASCDQGRRALTRILDKILTPPLHLPPPTRQPAFFPPAAGEIQQQQQQGYPSLTQDVSFSSSTAAVREMAMTTSNSVDQQHQLAMMTTTNASRTMTTTAEQRRGSSPLMTGEVGAAGAGAGAMAMADYHQLAGVVPDCFWGGGGAGGEDDDFMQWLDTLDWNMGESM